MVNINLELIKACEGGHMDIVMYMIERGANNWNTGLYYACKGGHMDIVMYMIERGADDWNRGLTIACFGCHIDIVRLMIEHGASTIDIPQAMILPLLNLGVNPTLFGNRADEYVQPRSLILGEVRTTLDDAIIPDVMGMIHQYICY